ncbi:hypothetical protein C5H40_05370 [Acinetobacter baumannii]|nr:hypothetical protein C5H40_05370 [Acinetobacter baumannii]
MLNFFSTLRNKQISLFMFNLIIAIWLGAILNIGFYHQVHTLTPYFGVMIYAELSGDFPLGDSRQPTYKSLRPFDLVS